MTFHAWIDMLIDLIVKPCHSGATWTPTDLARDMGTENPFKVPSSLAHV